ncbi:putative complex I intermediate associated protein [Cryphonectria parasitica EP155]|uniref:Complex I intermediate associated protein n=1 Tax=Cryphonectria parasitica (strain ATCC 38755 / EP155) TaxID=660469 RepID=A0A9P4Y9X4_CRYP1|nr:putative complex I intermediate associated protein [Cryphonectria parasitica EP155]KAF3768735.1 putative complex I intermediate associated protein [Cryphonectria parasitica EP155]
MRATSCLAKGFWGRSLDEFKRLSQIAMNLEGVKGPSGPRELYSFHSRESMETCRVFSDADMGGFSKAQLDWTPPRPLSERPTSSSFPNPSENPNGHARFHGSISTQLPKNRPEVERSGYAAWKTLDRPPTLFGKSVWDIDPYAFLALRIKSDGRSYLVNIQTESLVPTDLHQHRLFSKRPGEWETVLIRFNDFVRTNHGFVVEPQTEMLRQKVRTVGIGLTDRIAGPFDLSIERIWATNNAREADHVDIEPEGAKEGQLKSKDGKSINWAG